MIVEGFERIARRYCQLMGLDPDEQVADGADPGPSGFVPDALLYSPRWKLVAKQSGAQVAWFKAISECLSDQEGA